MATVTINDASLTAIADAIRDKLEVETTYKPSQMAAAIEGIEGSGVLIQKTITQNGTYSASDDEADGYSSVTVNVSGGGGGSANILSGTENPTAQDGTNGAIFLLTYIANVYDSDFPADKLSLSRWSKNGAEFTKFDNSYNPASDENTLDHTGGNGYERVYVSAPVETNTDYIFELDYYSPSGVSNGYNGQINIAASVASNIAQSSTIASKIAYTNLSTAAQSDYSHYTVQFNSVSNSSVYLVIDLNIFDGKNCVLKFKNFSFHKVGDTPQLVQHEKISSALLKVDGAWAPIDGQDINDVNLGS